MNLILRLNAVSERAKLVKSCVLALLLVLFSSFTVFPISEAYANPCGRLQPELGCGKHKEGKEPGTGDDKNDQGGTGNGGGSGDGGNANPESDTPRPGPGLICDYEEDGKGVPCPPNMPDPPEAPEDDGGGSVAPPVPSESDFASFQIPPSTPHALPVDWTVTGKPTAFWADASVRTFSAELLGFPLQVRATPIEFHWDFGDGNSTSTTSPGQEPSHPQNGSITHTYSTKGERTVTLTTVYTGEYSYGSGWSTIPGTAAVESDGLPMTVYRYHKYRVEDDCNVNPYGTDCVTN